MSTKPKKVHYVNNKQLYAAMVEYKLEVKRCEELGLDPPRVTPYIGECIMKIATHLAYRPNFSNYSFRDEMVSDGIENCLRYINNFNHEKWKNPFAYFTQIIYHAYIRRIQSEKKFLYSKHVATQMAELQDALSVNQGHDGKDYGTETQYGEWSHEQMLRFIEDFEENKRKRKRKVLEK